MRFITGMVSVAVMIAGAVGAVSAPALAQQGPEYVNHEYRFMINFSVPPMEQDTVYLSSDGGMHAARVFSVDEGTDRYRVTVVRFPAELADVEAELNHAGDLVGPRDRLLHDEIGSYDGAPGREMILADPEGRQVYANVLYNDRHLYLVQADVSAESAAPIRFQTSIVILGADGNPICSQEDRDACLTISN